MAESWSEKRRFWIPIIFSGLLGLASIIWSGYQLFFKDEKIDDLDLIRAAVAVMFPFALANAHRLASLKDQTAAVNNAICHEIKDKDKEIAKAREEVTNLSRQIQRLALNEIDLQVRLPVRVSNFHNFLAYLPLYIALDSKFLDQERLLVRLEHRGNDDSSIQALADGSCQISITDPASIFRVAKDNPNIKIVAPFLNKAAVWAVSKTDVKKASAGDGTCGDKYEILTYPRGSTAYMFAESWREKHFPSAEVTTFDRLSNDESMESYLNRMYRDNNIGRFDILVLSEPEITWLNRMNIFPHRYSLHDEIVGGGYFAFSSVISTSDFIGDSQGKEILRRFLKALRVAYNVLYALTPLNIHLIGKQPSGLEKPASAALLAASDRSSWEEILSALKRYTFECYPAAMRLSDEELLTLVESLRRDRYFARAVSYRNPDVHNGLYEAYRLAFGAAGALGADNNAIDRRIFWPDKDLQLTC